MLLWYPNARPPKDDEEVEEEKAPLAKSPRPTSSNGSVSHKKAADVLCEILTAAGKPLSRAELLKSAASRGIEISKEYASQIMSRDNRFNGIGHGRGAKWAALE